MNWVLWIKAIVFIGTLVGSQLVLRSTAKRLNETEKKLLTKATSGLNKFRKYLIYGVIIINVFLHWSAPELRQTTELFMLIVLAGGGALLMIFSYLKLKDLEVARAALNGYLLSALLFLTGFLVLLIPF
jgi:hypothetical protein